jgi:hypothetical protein
MKPGTSRILQRSSLMRRRTVPPSMIVFCKVFWKMHVFMYCRRKFDLGASRNLHAVGQEMDHAAIAWLTRG